MNAIKCFVIDDELFGVKLLQKYIEQTDGLEYLGGETNPIKAMKQIRSKEVAPNVCFVDIEMKGMSGIEIADELGLMGIEVIFTTGHGEYLGNAFERKVVDYLLKPFDFKRFSQSIALLKRRLEEGDNEGPYIFIKLIGTGSLKKLYCKHIYYIESVRNYCNFVTTEKVYTTYFSLKMVEELLQPYAFVRIHRSYVINFNRIKQLDGNLLTMDNNVAVNVGELFKADLLRWVHARLLANRRSRF